MNFSLSTDDIHGFLKGFKFRRYNMNSFIHYLNLSFISKQGSQLQNLNLNNKSVLQKKLYKIINRSSISEGILLE